MDIIPYNYERQVYANHEFTTTAALFIILAKLFPPHFQGCRKTMQSGGAEIRALGFQLCVCRPLDPRHKDHALQGDYQQ
jgi:mRNA-degrading endonuclease YafQ of YafQ-DinJ toxin-antitoxin module